MWQIREKELNYYSQNCLAVGTQAAVVHHGPSPSSPHAPRRAPVQVLLANPVCVCAYAVASFLFFRHRIPYEEHFLVRFFGEEYLRYRERTWIGIPGIRSIRPGELWATDS